jgi:hypothetical protein
MLRRAIAIILIVFACMFDAVAGAYWPSAYGSGISAIAALMGFAALAWAFVPLRNRTRR